MKNTAMADQLRAAGLKGSGRKAAPAKRIRKDDTPKQATSAAQAEIAATEQGFASLQKAVEVVIGAVGFKPYTPRLDGFDKPSEDERRSAEYGHKRYTNDYLGRTRAAVIRSLKEGTASPEDIAYRLVASDFLDRVGYAIPAIFGGIAKAKYEASRGRLSGVVNTLRTANQSLERFDGFEASAEGLEAYAPTALNRAKNALAQKRGQAERALETAQAEQADLFTKATAGDNGAKNRLKAADQAVEKAQRHLAVVNAAIDLSKRSFDSELEAAANVLIELYKLEQYEYVGKQRQKRRKTQKAEAKAAKAKTKPTA